MGNSSSSEDESAKENTKTEERPQKKHIRTRRTQRRKRFLQIGKFSISVVKGSIIDQTTDVIVTGSVPSLELNKARTSKLLLDKAGDSIQDECKEKYPSGITFSDVAITGPGRLDCQHIFHVTIQKFSSKGDEKNLEKCIMNCLAEADRLGMTSIAFPALGTGFLGYPPKLVAAAMFHAVENFDKGRTKASLKIINCVVFADDTFKEILTEAKIRATSKGLEELSLVTRASCSSNMGKIHISVIVDTITSQTADVIVCTCSSNLKLCSRPGLPKNLVEVAGSVIQSELDRRYPNGMKVGDLVVTNGYNLKCRKVYFGCLSPFFGEKKEDQLPEQVLYSFVYKCLASASKHGCKSLTLPALGTGYLKFPPDLAASKVIQAIKDFHNKEQQTSLREVKIVIFGGTNDWAKIEKAYIKSCTPQSGNPNEGHKQPLQTVPPKGTRAYFKYKYLEEPKPPSYWTHFKNSKTIKEWNTTAKGNTAVRKQPGLNISKAISSAFTKTLRTQCTIVSIERIENISLYENYVHECQRMFRKASINGACIPLASTKGSRGEAACMKHIDDDTKKYLHPEINEVYLFHGTKRNLVDIIGQQGFDDRLAKMNFGRLRLGNGVYSAEESYVSKGYTDGNDQCKMFLMRVCLGDVYTTPQNIEKLTRPPCKSGCIGVCTDHPDLFDSVVGEWPGMCREFTVYDRAKCYPEYIITYTIP
ncbi:protein mono-ADP-ribosyltransferase PARP15-like [Mytilus edulis]|uniref:protein mono-ADP-ribosyltransferase PARP15-like n=1 Tax=Mytilus edulis TaxID=6550 RepID=UPI0039F086C1